MTSSGVLAFVAFALALATLTLWPRLRRGDHRIDPCVDPLPERRLVRDNKLQALRELELDHRTGVVGDDEYRTLVGELRREAMEALRALEDAERKAALDAPQR